MPDPTTLPASESSRLHLTTPHSRRFETLGNAIREFSLPEAELRQQFAANPDGSVGRSLMSPEIRRAITVDARIKPDYSRIRVPVLAIYQADGPFEKVAGALHHPQRTGARRITSGVCGNPRDIR